MPYYFSGSSIKVQGHTGWKTEDLNPIWVRLLGRSQLSNPSDLPCWEQHFMKYLDDENYIINLHIFSETKAVTNPYDNKSQTQKWRYTYDDEKFHYRYHYVRVFQVIMTNRAIAHHKSTVSCFENSIFSPTKPLAGPIFTNIYYIICRHMVPLGHTKVYIHTWTVHQWFRMFCLWKPLLFAIEKKNYANNVDGNSHCICIF